MKFQKNYLKIVFCINEFKNIFLNNNFTNI